MRPSKPVRRRVALIAVVALLVRILMLVVTFVVVQVWTWRAHSNLWASEAADLRFSPGWADCTSWWESGRLALAS